MNAAAGKYEGMDRFEARKALWADIEAQGLAIKKENYTIRYTCGHARAHRHTHALVFIVLLGERAVALPS